MSTAGTEVVGRRLGGLETALARTDRFAPFQVVAALRWHRAPSHDRVRGALDQLQRCHAMLRVRLVEQRGIPRFRGDGVGEVPLRSGPGRWPEAIEEELAERLDSRSGPLLRARRLEDEQALILTFHHAAMDHASGAHLLAQLLAALRGEQLTPVEDQVLPPPAESRFPATYRGLSGLLRCAGYLARQAIDEVDVQLRSIGARKAAIHPEARTRILSRSLAAGPTRELLRRCHRRRLTPTAVLDAALLLAVGEELYPGRRPPFRFFVFPDLRPRLTPPAPPEQLAAYITMLRLTILAEGDLWSLAGRIQKRTYRALRRGDRFTSFLTASSAVNMLLRRGSARMGTAALSYGGTLRLGDDSELVDFRGFVSGFTLGPEWAGQARLWRGRLCCDFTYLDRDLDPATAGRLADRMLELLNGG